MIYAFGRLWLQRLSPPVLTYSNLLLIFYQSVVFQIDKAFHASLPKVHIRIFLGYNRTFIIERYAQCQKWAESLNCKNLGCKSSKNARQNQSRAGTKKLDGKGDFCIRSHPGKFSPPRNVELLKKYFSKSLLLKPNYRWKIKTGFKMFEGRSIGWAALWSDKCNQSQPSTKLWPQANIWSWLHF